jgi:hypothetical protein
MGNGSRHHATMPQTDPNKQLAIWSAATLTTTTNSPDFSMGAAGARFFLNISAVSGTTPTLVVKIQVKDPVSGNYVDLLNAVFASQNATGEWELTVYPGITTAANQAVSYVVTSPFRAVATIGGTTPSFTFSLTCVPLS